MPAAAPALLPARWFDGRQSQPQRVLVGLHPSPRGPALHLHVLGAPGDAPRVWPHAAVGWPEAWNARHAQPRVALDLGDDGSIEIDDVPAWHAAYAAAGGRPGMAQRLQTRWAGLLAGLLVAVVALTLFYRYGTPWAAAQMARWVPLEWEVAMAQRVLQQFDDGMLRPSKLPADRQAALRARFAALVAAQPAGLQRYRHYQPRWVLEFRSGMPPNAFALPGGTVVVTDTLVELATRRGLGDDAVVGVLAHEIGHVVQRHSMRMLVEQGVLQIGLGMALGDVSGVVATGSTLLTGLAYSRQHEREADCHALGLLRQTAQPTAPMAHLLRAMAQEPRPGAVLRGKAPRPAEAGASQPRPAPGPERAPERTSGTWEAWLSTHPETLERADMLERGHAPHCPH